MCQSVFPFELRPLHLTLQSGLSSQVTLFSFARFVCFRFRFRFTFRFVLFCLSFFEKPLLLPLFKFNCGVPQPPLPTSGHFSVLRSQPLLRARQTLLPLAGTFLILGLITLHPQWLPRQIMV